MAVKKLQPVHLYHVPGFRSSRVLWLYYELMELYNRLCQRNDGDCEDGDCIGACLKRQPALIVNEFTDANCFRNKKPEWFLEMNPNGKVPVMVDTNTNVTLFESGAICFYLLDQYDPEGLLLSRTNAVKRALFFQVAFYCTGTVDNLASTSSPVQRAIMSTSGKPANMVAVINPVNRTAWYDVCAPFFEKLLTNTDKERKTRGKSYLDGANFSGVDVFFGHCVRNLRNKGGDEKPWVEENKHPYIHAYVRSVRERPGLKFAITPSQLQPQEVNMNSSWVTFRTPISP
eukprot:CFRG2156T1